MMKSKTKKIYLLCGAVCTAGAGYLSLCMIQEGIFPHGKGLLLMVDVLIGIVLYRLYQNHELRLLHQQFEEKRYSKQ